MSNKHSSCSNDTPQTYEGILCSDRYQGVKTLALGPSESKANTRENEKLARRVALLQQKGIIPEARFVIRRAEQKGETLILYAFDLHMVTPGATYIFKYV